MEYRIESEKICPHGGKCIDPGIPSDCEANRMFYLCAQFSSAEEKVKFDALPDKYTLSQIRGNGTTVSIKFKNQVQVDFFLKDRPEWAGCNIVVENSEEGNK